MSHDPFFRHKTLASITVEAALAVPVFLVSLVPFLYVIRMMLVQTIVEDAVTSCVQTLSCQSYVLSAMGILEEDEEDLSGLSEQEAAGWTELTAIQEENLSAFSPEMLEKVGEEAVTDLAGQFLLRAMLQKHLSEEDMGKWGVEGAWNGISLDGSRFFCSRDGHTCLIEAHVTIDWESPFSFWDPPDSTILRTGRAFTGVHSSVSPEEEEEEAARNETVYTIGAGTRYHKSSCYLIDKKTSSMSRGEALTSGFFPCGRCGGGTSETVYFSSGGETFHSRDCTYLFPNLHEMTLEEAVLSGYTPCALCYGSEGYFQ